TDRRTRHDRSLRIGDASAKARVIDGFLGVHDVGPYGRATHRHDHANHLGPQNLLPLNSPRTATCRCGDLKTSHRSNEMVPSRLTRACGSARSIESSQTTARSLLGSDGELDAGRRRIGWNGTLTRLANIARK